MRMVVAGARGAIGKQLAQRRHAAGHEATDMPRLSAVAMIELRGACGADARSEPQWRPAHPSWWQGVTAA